MTKFHTDEYIDFLTKVTPANAPQLTMKGTQFLVGEDNPPFEGLFEFCSISAGGSVGKSSCLILIMPHLSNHDDRFFSRRSTPDEW